MARQNHEVRKIAEAVGFRRQTVTGFMHGGSGSPALLQKCEHWARENGYWPWDGFDSGGSDMADREGAVRPEFRRVAGILRAIADYCEDESPPGGTKLRRVRADLANVIDGIDEAAREAGLLDELTK